LRVFSCFSFPLGFLLEMWTECKKRFSIRFLRSFNVLTRDAIVCLKSVATESDLTSR
jgi:hypothetical protein